MTHTPELEFSYTPPPHWESRCADKVSLVHSTNWHRVLENGFGAKTLYVSELESNAAFSINIFKAGPFRIGYLGFPTGGLLNGTLSPALLDIIQLARLPLDLLRIQVSGFGPLLETDLPSLAVPETSITDLERWELRKTPKFKRNVEKAQRNGIRPLLLNDVTLAGTIYTLYRDTVLRHNSMLRYTEKYFRALAELSQHCQLIKCWVVIIEGRLSGFIVAALEGGTAYYLHGAMNDSLRNYGGSAILFYCALQWAQHLGARQFNFMSSPPNQLSLVSYKEKMGGVTRQHHTYELHISPMRAKLFKMALWSHNLTRTALNQTKR